VAGQCANVIQFSQTRVIRVTLTIVCETPTAWLIRSWPVLPAAGLMQVAGELLRSNGPLGVNLGWYHWGLLRCTVQCVIVSRPGWGWSIQYLANTQTSDIILQFCKSKSLAWPRNLASMLCGSVHPIDMHLHFIRKNFLSGWSDAGWVTSVSTESWNTGCCFFMDWISELTSTPESKHA